MRRSVPAPPRKKALPRSAFTRPGHTINLLKRTSTILSPAKINLSLEILGRRPDGYHEILTIFQSIDLSDQLTFDWDSETLDLVCANPDVPNDESNLIFKAVKAVEKKIGVQIKVKVTLDKKIPMGAGLGGGSGNAAAVLLEAGRKLKIPPLILREIGETLGADVPFFLNGGTALGKGKGETLEPLPKLPRFPIVVVKPQFSISTAHAYGKISRYSTGEKTVKLAELIKSGKHDQIFDFLTNDFEEALFSDYPLLKEIKEMFLAHGARAAQLSGSGSAVFAFARDDGHAKKLAREVEKFGFTWVTQT